jgi:nicotinamide mononucleotide transporter
VIDDLSVQLVSAWRDTSWVEILAAVLAAAYLPLAIRQRLECWVAAFVSSCLYVCVFFRVHLYMESALNAFCLRPFWSRARSTRIGIGGW